MEKLRHIPNTVKKLGSGLLLVLLLQIPATLAETRSAPRFANSVAKGDVTERTIIREWMRLRQPALWDAPELIGNTTLSEWLQNVEQGRKKEREFLQGLLQETPEGEVKNWLKKYIKVIEDEINALGQLWRLTNKSDRETLERRDKFFEEYAKIQPVEITHSWEDLSESEMNIFEPLPKTREEKFTLMIRLTAASVQTQVLLLYLIDEGDPGKAKYVFDQKAKIDDKLKDVLQNLK